MGTPARLLAALERLEARRRQLEHQIVDELEARFFSTTDEPMTLIEASHDGNHVAGSNIDTTGAVTSNASHITVAWLGAA